MARLCYGSFAEILIAHIVPEIIKLDLTNILLPSPAFLVNKQGELVDMRKTHFLGSDYVTRISSGERPLPPALREYYAKPDAPQYVKETFRAEIIPRILDSDKNVLLEEILYLIQQDDVLPEETKTHLRNLATLEQLEDFLAEVYLCAIHRKPDAQKIENLPRQNRFFYGREDLLAALNRRYQDGVHVQSVFGMGGVGKTQLALQYTHLYAEDYETIWWINAENKASLQSSVSKFLSAQKIKAKGKDADSVRRAFLNYCAKHSGWFFVYDNAEYGTEEEYQTLADYFPKPPLTGDILLTTRCKNTFEDAVHFEVPVWNQEEAAAFLQRRSRLDDEQGAEILALQLGFLPLAIEYAAAYIRETPNVDYTAYSEKLERYGIKVLDRKVGYQAYKNTVREAFHITLDRLLENAAINPISKSAEQFLNICAFLAPDEIQLSIFSDYGKGLLEPLKTVLGNELDRDELIRDLTRYSLVQVDRNIMSIHRLLQEVLRDELDPDTEMLCINYAYGVFYSIFYSAQSAPLEQIKLLLADSVPHVQSILRRYVQRYQRSGQRIPDNIMVAKEYFSWSSLLVADTKQLKGHELATACNRNIAVLQTAADFYDTIPGTPTIYPAFVLLLLAQAYETLGNTPATLHYYFKALNIADEAIAALPMEPDVSESGTVQAQYQVEAYQLASDICAAIASSVTVGYDAELLWRNFRSLKGIVQREIACRTKNQASGRYQEAVRFLWLFSRQVADCTQRAFILRLYLPQSKRKSLDGPFAFFVPAVEVESEVPAEMVNGFDILLERDNMEIAKMLEGAWTTLAFPQNVRSEEDMLVVLMELEDREMSASARLSLLSMIYELARYLRYEDIKTQYEDKLRNIQLLVENTGK